MTQDAMHHPGDNDLLSRLHEADRLRLYPHMTVHEFAAGHVLHRAGDPVLDTWFPCGTAIATFQIWADDGREAVEVAMIGREGAVGGIVSNGRVPAYATAVVRTPGRFLHIRTSALESAKTESVALRHWFSRYSDCLIAQVFQNTACNALHDVSQRAAKWLLATAARSGTTEIAMTQTELAGLLGVGRTFVSRVVGEMRRNGLVETRRGLIVLRDVDRLSAAACGCARSVAAHFDTVLLGVYPDEG